MRRHFDPVAKRVEGGGLRRFHVLQCRSCPVKLEVSANTYSGSRAHADLMKIFNRNGWKVGRSPQNDVCPECQKRQRRTLVAQPVKEGPMTSVSKPRLVAPTSAAPARKPAAPAAAPLERTLSFDDRRLIIAKLQDHYVDENAGYAPGWTDHKVATDLGVPRKWVEDIREQNFGPAKDNEDIRTLVSEAKQTLLTANELVKMELEIVSKAGALEKLIGDFKTKAVAISSAITNLDRRVADIEKAMR